MKYSEIEKQAIAYLSKQKFPTTTDCRRALRPHLEKLAMPGLDNRSLDHVVWGVLESVMSIVAIESGEGSNRCWRLKQADDLGLLPADVIAIVNEVERKNAGDADETKIEFITPLVGKYGYGDRPDNPDNATTGVYYVTANETVIWEKKGIRGRDMMYALFGVLDFASRAYVNPPPDMIKRYEDNLNILHAYRLSGETPHLPPVAIHLVDMYRRRFV